MKPSCTVFRVGTRGSKLALVQTGRALDRLAALLPGIEFEAVPLSSPGDRDRACDLRKSPPDFFTRDLDDAVRAGELDAALHSAKDLPDPVPQGLDWCWLPWRVDPRDALVLRPGARVSDLPPEPRIGVSSERREAWCRRRFPRARTAPVRGNIEERLAQLDDGAFDAVVMAAAALLRLDLAERISEWIPREDLATPNGQGALALTFREGDARMCRLRSLCVKAVAFVGAGSGSAGACTLDGKEALETCEVCLYDALIDPSLLDWMPSDAVRIDVGKRCGHHRATQAEITRLIVDHARRGRRVVRLKGGDPGLFGRLAEEVEALEALRLPFRVVPGVSSLTAATTGTGMLLTRRGVSRGVCVMTPRGERGVTVPVTREERARLPIVFFMGTKVLGEVAAQLLADGEPGETPVALVHDAGTDRECVARGTLSQLPGAVSTGPGLVVVGAIAGTAFDRSAGALQGRRVLITCSRALQPEAVRAVRDVGGQPLSFPMIRLTPCPEAGDVLRKLGAYDWIVVTSPSAVRCLASEMRSLGLDLRRLPRIMVSGRGTARALRDLGLEPEAVPDEGAGSDAVVSLAERVLKADDRVLRVRSDRAGPDLAERVAAGGARVEDCVLYLNEPIAYDACPEFDAAFFASASAVDAFVEGWGSAALRSATVVAIGRPTADALAARGAPANLISPAMATRDSLMALAGYSVAQALKEHT